MKPTQEKLAELAAAIAAGGRYKPREAVRTALGIWDEAQKQLAAQAELEAKLEAADAQLAEYEAKLPEGEEVIGFEDFLKLFVDKKTDRARKYWRDFNRSCLSYHKSLKGKALEAAVEKAMERERLEGFPRNTALMQAKQYAEWRARDKAERLSERGRKGATASKKNATTRKKR